MQLVSLTRRPQLLGLDLDGTVVNSNNQVPAAIQQELQAWHAAGITLAFLTGRRPLTAGKHLDAIGLPAYAATNSGCLLWEYPSWKPLAQQYFPPNLVLPIADMLAPHSANFYVDSLRHGFEFFYLEREPSPLLDEYLSRWGFQARRIKDPGEMEGYQITQVAMPETDGVTLKLRDAILERFGGQLLAMAVRWPLLPCLALEVFHPDANKGSALAYFASLQSTPHELTAAVGDDVNDLAMIEWAGLSAAMPNSAPELAAAAKIRLEGEQDVALARLLKYWRELPP